MNIKVDSALLGQFSAEFGQYSNELSTFQDDLKNVQRNLSQCSGLTIHSKLQSINTGISSQISDINKLQKAAKDAAEEYHTCESRLTGNESSGTAQDWLGIDSGLAKKLIGSFGLPGTFVSAKMGLSEGGLAGAKSATKLVGEGAKIVQKAADGKRIDLLGLTPAEPKGFFDGFSKYVYDPAKCTTTAAKNASKISVAANWVSLAFSGMTNFADNFEEFDADFKNPRLYAETLTETAIDVLVGMGTTWLATTIVTAVAVSPPMWAVSITAIGITAAQSLVSGVAEAQWGIDLKETVSDALIKDATVVVGKP